MTSWILIFALGLAAQAQGSAGDDYAPLCRARLEEEKKIFDDDERLFDTYETRIFSNLKPADRDAIERLKKEMRSRAAQIVSLEERIAKLEKEDPKNPRIAEDKKTVGAWRVDNERARKEIFALQANYLESIRGGVRSFFNSVADQAAQAGVRIQLVDGIQLNYSRLIDDAKGRQMTVRSVRDGILPNRDFLAITMGRASKTSLLMDTVGALRAKECANDPRLALDLRVAKANPAHIEYVRGFKKSSGDKSQSSGGAHR
ncbi:MAG TPA: hypothetical protein PKC28_12845 [Bdellovibrionales bacterium]|nr:hypothetical protein [Bdellovibrionales bacterium]